jgi:RNA-directed DNA polymerase
MRESIETIEDFHDWNFNLLKIFVDIAHSDFEKIVNIENLFRAWRTFRVGKTKKADVMIFERNLEDNLFVLASDLKNGIYTHGKYKHFTVSDPKKRDIHKAEVRDRIVHQIIYNYLVQLFDPDFMEHSYSSRLGKGTHRAVRSLRKFSKEISRNNFGDCYAVKCDVRRYFDNIDHLILFDILRKKVKYVRVRELLLEIINSFQSKPGKGVPLGNVTSQIFANIYLNELDQHILKKLKVGYYIRYNDDFIILGSDRKRICETAKKAVKFAEEKLLLEIPDEKTVFRKLKWGIDFCGYIALPNGILLRHKTKNRLLKNIFSAAEKFRGGEMSGKDFFAKFNSYSGLLKHCDSYNLRNKLANKCLYETIF